MFLCLFYNVSMLLCSYYLMLLCMFLCSNISLFMILCALVYCFVPIVLFSNFVFNLLSVSYFYVHYYMNLVPICSMFYVPFSFLPLLLCVPIFHVLIFLCSHVLMFHVLMFLCASVCKFLGLNVISNEAYDLLMGYFYKYVLIILHPDSRHLVAFRFSV